MEEKKLIAVLLVFGVIFAFSTIAFEKKSSVYRSEYAYGVCLEWNSQYGLPFSFLSVTYKRTILGWLGRDPSWDFLYEKGAEDYEMLSQQYFNPQIEQYAFKFTFFIDVLFWFSLILLGFKILKLQELDVRAKLKKIFQVHR